jgi:hypothetical protein
MGTTTFMKAITMILLWGAAVGLPAAEQPPLEKRVLFGGDSAKSWSAAEATLEASGERVKVSGASLHWHVTVDYQAGEAKYPVGWPRVSHVIAEKERDWSDWEYLRMWVYTETSRAALPREPVGLALHTPDKASAFHRPLTELKKGAWVEVTIPIAQLPHAGDVRLIQFHISESNYRHGDTLDLYLDDLALVRHASPALAEFAAESAVMFADAPYLPVTFQVLGVKAAANAEVGCELRCEGRTAARGAWKVPRGPQRCVLDLGRARLAPGDYELVARIAGGTPATTRLRVVESPWEEAAR